MSAQARRASPKGGTRWRSGLNKYRTCKGRTSREAAGKAQIMDSVGIFGPRRNETLAAAAQVTSNRRRKRGFKGNSGEPCAFGPFRKCLR